VWWCCLGLVVHIAGGVSGERVVQLALQEELSHGSAQREVCS
jgi:hypothetical protein